MIFQEIVTNFWFLRKYQTINIDIPDELIEKPSELINFAADAMAELVSKIQL